ncbi:hypothetical protein [Longimicrobium terrae]|uniref:Uncharacterized protein n=1 Tax=Longimicrobium terrae TaxID=1639882 RepID=A0A841GZD3_9BACT|nr:hypothetical protein [Longimicrobium terrae]MBB4636888.1 hypothetical protein [Longimicrobium terrae]MBB6071113.1 hypothetical protein [Longimicrobium terrae]NNC29162.1 hypothetical protein [Longimicrobium terrae]
MVIGSRRIGVIGLATLLAGLGGATYGAPGGHRAVVLPGDMTGCYSLYDERGRPASESLYFAPPKVRLDPTPYPVRGDSAWRLAKLDRDGRDDADPRSHRGTQYWAADSLTDSIHVVFHTNFSGSELILSRRLDGDTLRGRAMEEWDNGPSTNQAGAVTAIRYPCGPEAS